MHGQAQPVGGIVHVADQRADQHAADGGRHGQADRGEALDHPAAGPHREQQHDDRLERVELAGRVSFHGGHATFDVVCDRCRGGVRGLRTGDAVTAHQHGDRRSADHPAADDAGHRRGHRDRLRAAQAGGLERGCEGEAGRRSTGQRRRAGQHAEHRMQVEQPRDRDAHQVLHHREEGGQQQEQHHRPAAGLEQAEAGVDADRGEERDHQRRLQGGVELEQLGSAGMCPPDHQRHQQAADHRFRQVVAAQHRDRAAQRIAGEQRQSGEGDGLDDIQLDHARASGRSRRTVSQVGPAGPRRVVAHAGA